MNGFANFSKSIFFDMKKGSRIGFSVFSESEVVFQTYNPILDKNNDDVFCQASEDEINLAISLAEKAFLKYRCCSGLEKANFFNEIIRLIEVNEKELISIYCLETGLDEIRANVELTRTVNQILNFSKLIFNDSWRICSVDAADIDRVPPRPEIRKGLFPLGPVVIFGASNFPFAYSTIGGDSISALAAGCPIIIKSHPLHAGTSDLMASIVLEAAQKTNMPEGIFSNLNAIDNSVGERLVLDPRIKAVGFTGSVKGGEAILKLVQNRDEPIPVFAEMGSSNPIIVFPSILENGLEFWAENLSKSITNNAGQFCTKPGLIFVLDSKLSNEFIELLKCKILEKDFQCMLHPTIFQNFERLIDERRITTTFACKEGMKKRNYVSPSISICESDDFLRISHLKEEVFGPFSIVVKCKTEFDLKKCINSLEGQLTGTILCEENNTDFDDELFYLLQSKVGRLIFNGVPTGVEIVESMHHGGPFPASSDSRFTAVGIHSIKRFVRPIAFQNYPVNLIPDFLK